MKSHILDVEAVVENEIRQGLSQRQVAQTYALAIRSDWPTDWPRVNAAITARWPKALERIKRMAWSGSCFENPAALSPATSTGSEVGE